MNSPAPETSRRQRQPRWLPAVLLVVAAALLAGTFVKVRATYFPLAGPFVFDPAKPFTFEFTSSRESNHLNPCVFRQLVSIDPEGNVEVLTYRDPNPNYTGPKAGVSKTEVQLVALHLSAGQKAEVAELIRRHQLTAKPHCFDSGGSCNLPLTSSLVAQGKYSNRAIRLDEDFTSFLKDFTPILYKAGFPEVLGGTEVAPEQFLQKWAPIQAEIDDAFEAEWERRQSEEFWSQTKAKAAGFFGF